MSDAQRDQWAKTAGMTTGNFGMPTTIPKRDNITDRIGHIHDQAAQCHALASQIADALGVPPDPTGTGSDKVPGIAGSLMALTGSVIELRQRLESILGIIR